MKAVIIVMLTCVIMAMSETPVYYEADHSAPSCLCEEPDVPVCDVNGGLHNPDCIEGCYHDEINSAVKVYDMDDEKCVDA